MPRQPYRRRPAATRARTKKRRKSRRLRTLRRRFWTQRAAELLG